MTCNCVEAVSPSYSVGKLQRANPLPPGVYWIDVIGEEDQATFAGWKFEHQHELLILVAEHFETQGDWPSRDWVKFEVKSPVAWNPSLGFPNIVEAGDDIESSSDTAQNPSNEELGICDLPCQVQKVGMVVGGLLVVGLLISVIKR